RPEPTCRPPPPCAWHPGLEPNNCLNLRPAMKRLQVAQTDLFVSPIGLGTVKLGRNQGVKYPQGFELPNDRQARELIAQAGDLGINLIDTAPAYGISEERLGGLLHGQRH